MKHKHIIISIVLLAVVIAFFNVNPFGINSAKEGNETSDTLKIRSILEYGSISDIIPAIESIGRIVYDASTNYPYLYIDELPAKETPASAKPIIVLDPGHGKSSRLMTDEEKIAAGYSQNNGQWGEWRHWKNGTAGSHCQGSGCNAYGTCWYPITSGDRDTEPALNLRLALRTKHYLENELGYTVRLTRSSDDENPSFSKRVSNCYPNGDLSATPDAAIYVCLHSNAGGGKGSAYIEANGTYTQKWINSQYVSKSNALGKAINDRIVSETSLSTYAGGRIGNLGYMILFNKCPVPAGYMEIGFFDSATDLAILNSEYDSIAKSIAYGIDDYFKN